MVARDASCNSLEVVRNDTSVDASGKFGVDKNRCSLTQTMTTTDGLVHRILWKLDDDLSKTTQCPRSVSVC